MRRERPGHTLQATAPVNGAHLRLIEVKEVVAEPRPLLCDVRADDAPHPGDSARARGNDKRGGGIPKVSVDEHLLVSPQQNPNLVALDAALQALEAVTRGRARWWS